VQGRKTYIHTFHLQHNMKMHFSAASECWPLLKCFPNQLMYLSAKKNRGICKSHGKLYSRFTVDFMDFQLPCLIIGEYMCRNYCDIGYTPTWLVVSTLNRRVSNLALSSWATLNLHKYPMADHHLTGFLMLAILGSICHICALCSMLVRYPISYNYHHISIAHRWW